MSTQAPRSESVVVLGTGIQGHLLSSTDCCTFSSGKSSLIMALFHALDESHLSGEVIIDDVDTASVAICQLRESMRYNHRHSHTACSVQAHLRCVCLQFGLSRSRYLACLST